MAERSGLSESTIGRIWRAFGLAPHRTDTFKLSTDPLFVEKVDDIVGLYLNPPEAAVVLSVDEKSQVQALARSQPAFPMMPGMCERRTHDYLRHGTTSLFAAFNTADGSVISSTHRRHRTIEFKKFLNKIDTQVPEHLDVHLICDNYGTHKSPAIQRWLEQHPRFHMHYTPTYSSWINQVERWFAYLTDDLLRRSDHRSVQALEKDIRNWVAAWNEDPKPFIWTKTADQILESLSRFLQRINGGGHTRNAFRRNRCIEPTCDRSMTDSPVRSTRSTRMRLPPRPKALSFRRPRQRPAGLSLARGARCQVDQLGLAESDALDDKQRVITNVDGPLNA
jgi:transposase